MFTMINDDDDENHDSVYRELKALLGPRTLFL